MWLGATFVHGDDASAERPPFRKPTDDANAGLDWNNDLDDDGLDIVIVDDDVDDEALWPHGLADIPRTLNLCPACWEELQGLYLDECSDGATNWMPTRGRDRAAGVAVSGRTPIMQELCDGRGRQ